MAYITATQWQNAAVNAFTRTARELLGITRKTDFEFSVQSHKRTAAVDWKIHRSGGKIIGAEVVLYLPAMKPGAKLTRRDADALAGYWIHELMHVLETDRQSWEMACTRGRMFSALVNGLEDVRGEGALLAKNAIPGARKCLIEITERAVWPGDVMPQDVNSKHNLPALLAYLGRAELLGYPLSRIPQFWAALTPANAAIVRGMLDKLKTASNTFDIYTIVAEFFEGNAKRQDGDKQDGDQQDGDKQDGDQQGATNKHGGDDFSDASEHEDAADAEPTEGAQDIADAANGGPLTGTEKALIGSHMRTTAIRGRYEICRDEFENLEGVGTLRIAIRRLIQSPDRYGFQNRLERGRLDPKSLHRARLGHRDVYRRVDEQEGHKAAVSLVLDQSGSMGHNVKPQAIMAYHIAAAVEAARAPVAVHGFTSSTTLARIKGFGERVKDCLDRFATAGGNALGNSTPLAPSIVSAARDLAAQDASERVLFILTDGGDDHGADRVCRAIRIAQEMGCQVVGVVITWRVNDDPRNYGFEVADAAITCPANELSGTVMKALVDRMDRKKAA